MSRNQKIAAGVLGAILVVLVAFIVVQLADDGDDGGSDERRAATATAPATTGDAEPEPAPQPEPELEPEPGPTTPTATAPTDTQPGDDPVVTTDIPSNATDEVEAAASFARNELGIQDTGEISITRSSADDRWILATFFAGSEPIAVWLRREGEGERWVGIASSRNGAPAPAGQGIPEDIRRPFSEP